MVIYLWQNTICLATSKVYGVAIPLGESNILIPTLINAIKKSSHSTLPMLEVFTKRSRCHLQ